MNEPLTVEVVNGKLVIHVGINTLAFCANPEVGGSVNFRVLNKWALAKDVAEQLQCQKEDGSTPVTDMLDQAMIDASHNGSDGFNYDEVYDPEDGKWKKGHPQ